jgi:hypothetical protein
MGSSGALSNTVWLAFSGSGSLLEDIFTGITIPFDCEFLVVQKRDSSIILTEVYHISPSRPLQMNCLGNWSPPTDISWPSEEFFQRRHSLQNIGLTAGVLQA